MAFRRVLVGVNGVSASSDALDQAGHLVDRDGTLRLLAAVDEWNPIGGQPGSRDELRLRAAELLSRLERELAGGVSVETTLAETWAAAALVREAKEWGADLVAVAMHDRGRAAGILLGKVASDVLHKAPCSVLLARPASEPDAFPRRIVVGADGSPAAEQALAVAQAAAKRTTAELVVIAARGADLSRVRDAVGEPLVEDDRPPVEALLDGLQDGDAIVVGSRGLGALRAIGSVSEKVAHQARCSVLVVRERESTGAASG